MHRFYHIHVYRIQHTAFCRAKILSMTSIDKNLQIIDFYLVFKEMFTFIRLVMRTTVNVKKGEELYTTYTHILYSTRERQKHLRDGKFFTCSCQRCTDPTELGTHFSSLLCKKCDDGAIVSKNPLGRLPRPKIYWWQRVKSSFEEILYEYKLQMRHQNGRARSVHSQHRAQPLIWSCQQSKRNLPNCKSSKHLLKILNFAKLFWPSTAKYCIRIITWWSACGRI